MIRAGKHVAAIASDFCAVNTRAKRVIIVADEIAARLFAREIVTRLELCGAQVILYRVFGGESAKTMDDVMGIYRALAAGGFDRHSEVVSLGGGAVSDMAGFAAATYMRGIKHAVIPTTLLSQVDAALGGKTAVNLDGVKNIIGAFHMPRAVYINTKTLDTLPDEVFAHGLAEVVKYGLGFDRDLFEFLEQNSAAILRRDKDATLRIVTDSVRIKLSVVVRDTLEHGKRTSLNLGHTLAHALEAQNGYSHGAAVAVGLVFAARLALRRGMLYESDVDRLVELLTAFGLPVSFSGNINGLCEIMKHDKKNDNGMYRFVLPHVLGGCKFGVVIADDELENELKLMCR